jgi:hypothetical protein
VNWGKTDLFSAEMFSAFDRARIVLPVFRGWEFCNVVISNNLF